MFPGQGSQHAGMGAGIFDDPELAALGDRASEASGVDLRHLLLDAGDEELKLTHNAQPALCFMGVALAHLLRRHGVEPSAAAGHSVGEYAALCVAGAMSVEDAISAVAERGRAMAEALPAGESSMAAVLGLSPAEVDAAVGPIEGVWPANYNTPSQTVVGGLSPALAKAEVALKAAGARRYVPLAVSAAFHTPLMTPAARRLRVALDRVGWTAPAVPVIANVDAEPYGSALPAAKLERQLDSPVRWAGCVLALTGSGCDSLLEVGPRRVLAGMMRELAPGLPVGSVATPEAAASLRW